MNTTIYYDSLNDDNERLQHIGDIILNLDYWDCECKNNFIHPISQQRCGICGSDQDESPSSRESEVQILLKNFAL